MFITSKWSFGPLKKVLTFIATANKMPDEGKMKVNLSTRNSLFLIQLS
jgi:hypothetical protein